MTSPNREGQEPTHWSAMSQAAGAGLFAIVSWFVPIRDSSVLRHPATGTKPNWPHF